MSSELGFIIHEYVWSGGLYYRRRLFGLPNWQVFTSGWVDSSPPA